MIKPNQMQTYNTTYYYEYYLHIYLIHVVVVLRNLRVPAFVSIEYVCSTEYVLKRSRYINCFNICTLHVCIRNIRIPFIYKLFNEKATISLII